VSRKSYINYFTIHALSSGYWGRPLRIAQVITAAVVLIVLTSVVAYTSYVPLISDDLEISLTIEVNPSLASDPDLIIPRVLGASIDWPDNANGLYDPLTGLLNPLPVGEVISYSPSHLRFPATSLSQQYNWIRGVGQAHERGTNPSHGEKPQESTFGTDEFVKLVNHTGAMPVMVVNANQYSPHNASTTKAAADWVSYCNDPSYRGMGKRRSLNGFPQPYGIKYWEVGYEMYKSGYWDRAHEDTFGVQYAMRLKEFSMAMKNVDPSIMIGASLVIHRDLETYSDYRTWNDNVIDVAGGHINDASNNANGKPYFDYVVVTIHLPRIDLLLNADDLYHYSYAMVVNSAQSIENDLSELRDMIDSVIYPSRRVPIAIASFFADFTSSGWNTQAPAQAGSVPIVADIAMEVLRKTIEENHRMLLYACYSDLNTPTFASLLINPDFKEAEVDKWERSTSYLVMDLIGELQEGILLNTDADDVPTYAVEEVTGLPHVKDVPVMGSLATYNPTSNRTGLLLVNRDISRDIKCKVTVAGWTNRYDLIVESIESETLLSSNLNIEEVTIVRETRRIGGNVFEITVPRAAITLVLITPVGAT
jgi:alpha-L-arabinofuranosidase